MYPSLEPLKVTAAIKRGPSGASADAADGGTAGGTAGAPSLGVTAGTATGTDAGADGELVWVANAGVSVVSAAAAPCEADRADIPVLMSERGMLEPNVDAVAPSMPA